MIDQVLLDEEGFVNFFRYFDGLPSQTAGVELLYKHLRMASPTLLAQNAEWIDTYRGNESKPPPKEEIEWPLSKADLGEIMLCSASSLPDSLMDDLAACCRDFGINTKLILGYFLGQCGHESAGLRYPLEIADGWAYEGRRDLANTQPGDGPKFRGCGFIQTTGRANHTAFSDFLARIGKPDRNILDKGSEYSCDVYPWSISGFWWEDNGMNEYCSGSPDIDRVGQRVNGKYLPNGYQDRRDYTNRAFRVLGI
ncbi:endolysin [uncultured phage_MedDCM-OCT-S38-C3]|uniref:Endopeptidase LytF n=1 Tax=uncultured phage_MedDCM-OCT-S38-C3 TaxID=2740803 RepID=A0A6S4PA66_9CAUD|nr:endolysin [uncultured phage_MedDCM-OCT-S38-C3]BAQ94455.1 endopeptidase LytF [uncultured phage_MedDCM-OCT-S38-C3]